MDTYLIKYVLIIIIISVIIFITTKAKNKMTIKDLEISRAHFLIYLDKFYIKNIWINIFNVSCYFILNIFIIVFIRLYFITYIVEIKDSFSLQNNFNVFELIFKVILLIIIIILFKLLLDNLFFTSLIKLHIFLRTKRYYQALLNKIQPYYLVVFFGKCYLFFYNITKGQTFRDLNDTSAFKEINEYDYIYENNFIVKLSETLIYYTNKFIPLYLFSFLLKTIFKWLYFHVRLIGGIISYLPKIIFILLILYDFTHFKIYYSLHIFYLYYISTIIINYLLFIHNKNDLFDSKLSIYFYNNKLNYKVHRVYLKTDLSYYLSTLSQDSDNQFILKNIQNLSLIVYILDDLKEKLDKKTQTTHKYLNSLYKRYYIIFLLPFIIYYFFKNNTFYIILIKYEIKINVLFLFIIIYVLLIIISKKTYLLKNKDEDDVDYYCFNYYKQNKLYNILFWIVTFSSIIFIYGLFLISKALIIDVILDYPNIKLLRYYTIEEKNPINDKNN